MALASSGNNWNILDKILITSKLINYEEIVYFNDAWLIANSLVRTNQMER